MSYRELLRSVEQRDIESVRRLLKGRAPVGPPWWARILLGRERPPLVLASSLGMLSIVELLLDAGADPNGSPGWECAPLGAACSNGNVELAELLLLRGADVNRCSVTHGSAIQSAAYRGKVAVLELLLSHGADPDLVLSLPISSLFRVRGSILRMLIQAGGHPSQELERLIERSELWP